MALNYVTITGTFDDGTGTGLSGTVTFTPSETVYYAGGPVVSAAAPVVATVTNGTLHSPSGGTLQLLATDNGGLTYDGMTGFFFWSVSVNVGGTSQSWSFFLPSNPSTVDLYALANTPGFTGGTLTQYLAPAVVTLTFAGTIVVNAALGNVFAVTLTSSAGTLGTPSNPHDGQVMRLRVIQDGSGSRTLSYTSAYDFGAAGSPTLSTGINKVDILGFEYDAALAKWCYLGSGLGF